MRSGLERLFEKIRFVGDGATTEALFVDIGLKALAAFCLKISQV